MIAGLARQATAAVILAGTLPALALSQAQRAPGAPSRQCAPRASAQGAAFVFGNGGGNLKRSFTRLWADGSLQPASGRRSPPNAALDDSVAALARFARESAFWTTIAPRITRPTRNPDMARHFLEVHLRCGAKTSVYPADAEPAAFHELFTRLTAISEGAARR